MNLTQDLNWLKTHLLLLGLVVGLAWGGVYGVESLVARHDAANALRADQQAAIVTAQNTAIQKQTIEAIQQLQMANQVLASQVAGLQQTINLRDSALVALQSQVKNMQPPQLATEWPRYVKDGLVTALPDGVHLDVPAAQATLIQLESVPVLVADKQDLKDSNQKLQQALSNSSQQLTQEQGALKSEQETHAADNKACQADKADLKSQARKSKSKIAAIFFGIGVMAARLAGI